MFDGIDARLAEESIDRRVGGWRVLASAWAVVLALMVPLAGAGAMACLHGHAQSDHLLAGAVIPQHDPCVGAGFASAPGVDGCESVPLRRDVSGWSNYW